MDYSYRCDIFYLITLSSKIGTAFTLLNKKDLAFIMTCTTLSWAFFQVVAFVMCLVKFPFCHFYTSFLHTGTSKDKPFKFFSPFIYYKYCNALFPSLGTKIAQLRTM